ncbi:MULTISPECIES: hypothetical protein [unclassified Campylobacter]|uniref:hypothetical protein n=1 Tax=unclassified Campylobacter TaxID=2593542 RepID=UPI0022E9E424|nr:MULTISPECIES: hypothetical protein [unclassified Campylobacter]MDA3062289.1 hypothetical protein [Campylobacter sp. JMF_14 EL1]MDA3073592.1 hypothetical protein [Campylobacter sp. JMF_10 EL2]
MLGRFDKIWCIGVRDGVYNRWLNHNFGAFGERISGELSTKQNANAMREAYARGLSQALSRGVEKGENAILDQNAKQFLSNGFINPNVASHIAISGTGALILELILKNH